MYPRVLILTTGPTSVDEPFKLKTFPTSDIELKSSPGDQ
jgi:hypothetical protein